MCVEGGAALTQTNTNLNEWQSWEPGDFHSSAATLSTYGRIEGLMAVLFSGSFQNVTV